MYFKNNTRFFQIFIYNFYQHLYSVCWFYFSGLYQIKHLTCLKAVHFFILMLIIYHAEVETSCEVLWECIGSWWCQMVFNKTQYKVIKTLKNHSLLFSQGLLYSQDTIWMWKTISLILVIKKVKMFSYRAISSGNRSMCQLKYICDTTSASAEHKVICELF